MAKPKATPCTRLAAPGNPPRRNGPHQHDTKEEIDAKFADFKDQTRDAIAEVPGPDGGDSPVARADRPREPEDTGDEPATPDAFDAKPEAREPDREAPPGSGTDYPGSATWGLSEIFKRKDK